MKAARLFEIAGALSTMIMSLVLVALLVILFSLLAGCCWLTLEVANTPIPTPAW